MTKRLLVTGGTGFVAGSVIAQGSEDWEVHALSRSGPNIAKPKLIWHQCASIKREDWEELVREIAPDVIIHTAALAEIDFCEANEEKSYTVNTRLTQELAEYAASTNTKMVYCSTDNVFDGENGPYAEEDPCEPVNYYGRCKYLGEKALRETGDNWVIARLSLVMGLPIFGTGNAFLARMIQILEEESELGVPPSEIRSPIDVITLGRALLELADNDFTGTLHLAGNDILSRVDIARRILTRFGYSEDQVVPREPENIPGRAPRPRDVSLINKKALEVLNTPLCGIEEGIDRILSRR